MNAVGLAEAGIAGVAGAESQRGWIESPWFDVALFTLSPLSGTLLVLAMTIVPDGKYLAAAAVYFVAIPHYLSTFTFYLGDENRAYYRTRWLAFLIGPALCVGVVFAAIVSRQAALFQSGQFTWNLYHVSLQSAGILGLYRWLNGGPPTERRWSIVVLVATAAAMAFLHLDRYPPLHDTLAALSPALPGLMAPSALAVAIPAACVLADRIRRRPRRIALPESAFLVSSVLLFHPYLWVADIELATLAMLMGHFVQYLAIVWLLHRRRYASLADGSAGQRLLRAVSANTGVLLTTLAAVGLLFIVFDRGSKALGIPWAYQITWNVLVILHFYLDGVIWTFRRPYVRESIGSYLVLPGHRVT